MPVVISEDWLKCINSCTSTFELAWQTVQQLIETEIISEAPWAQSHQCVEGREADQSVSFSTSIPRKRQKSRGKLGLSCRMLRISSKWIWEGGGAGEGSYNKRSRCSPSLQACPILSSHLSAHSGDTGWHLFHSKMDLDNFTFDMLELFYALSYFKRHTYRTYYLHIINNVFILQLSWLENLSW